MMLYCRLCSIPLNNNDMSIMPIMCIIIIIIITSTIYLCHMEGGVGGGSGLDEVNGILECPLCLDMMAGCKIYQCKYGHNVCERCNPLLNTCHSAGSPTGIWGVICARSL